jgi:hypothetical protein
MKTDGKPSTLVFRFTQLSHLYKGNLVDGCHMIQPRWIDHGSV